ncbi:hypothetical protein C3489_06215 [Streptomyces sp. Ru71]|uniref:hypothetical protein n=1 Tax=Streptomyces sp. Ru71 TaxID=2080746 RepID=UPI000CDD5AB5|nr:hypothetical protein [Streptomyces sp. Ru71]POX56310.1 hypothetical protein C3489_06215 [Streptomyces sp. Ru71]
MTQSDDAASGRLTALLEGAAGGRDGQAWSDLWTELYHNGSLDVSDPQVWRALTDMAEGVDADTASAALHLAGALLVQADRRHETRDLRDRHAPEVARLLAAAHRRRPATADRNDYCVLLETLVNLEGDVHWAEDLFWGIAGEEYELECPDPDCCAELWVVIGERASSGTSQDDVCSDDADTVPLQPAAPGALDGLGRRLYELALADGQEDVADALTHAFGAATCPECGGRVSVVAHLMARSG